MTREEAEEKAYKIMAVSLPASWIETHDGRMTKKAIKHRDRIADELMNAAVAPGGIPAYVRRIALVDYADGEHLCQCGAKTHSQFISEGCGTTDGARWACRRCLVTALGCAVILMEKELENGELK